MDATLKEYLDATAARFNTPAFILQDPVQFPHRFSQTADIEIVAILTSHIAWGFRAMICNNCEKLLTWMDGEPHRWLMEQEYESLDDDQCVHRTFFCRDLKYMMRGLHYIYKEYGTLQDFARKLDIAHNDEPAWKLTDEMNKVLRMQNDGKSNKFCFPSDMHKTALKRINMALRWLVRRDGIVDLGVWDVLQPSQLFIPLDVHVGNTARELGLISLKSNDKYAVLHLTEALREMRPDDPCYYDFALFGVDIEKASAFKKSHKRLLERLEPQIFQ